MFYEYFDGDDEILCHYGTPRHSGRYPWGSGNKNYQRRQNFLSRNNELKKEGISETERAKILGCRSIDHLRARVELYSAEIEKDNVMMAQKLKDKGYSNVAIAKRMGIVEGSVRNYLAKSKAGKLKIDAVNKIHDVLIDEMKKNNGLLDVSESTELFLGVSPDRLKKALENLKDEGYNVYTLSVKQKGTGNYTNMKVLAPAETTWKEMRDRRWEIGNLADVKIEDNGNGDVVRPHPPEQIDGKRIYIRYAEDGGTDRDGTIELRRGVPDLDMGKSTYAQVRIAVDGVSYLKGVAVYRDDIPDGYDIVFNTNKKSGTAPRDVFKDQKTEDPLNPFGAAIKPGGQRGALNIVREEGDWTEWSKTLPSQFLSKQPIDLAKKQLKLTSDIKNQQLEDILAIPNATLRKKMLLDFGEECDADAVCLKAASMPRQATHAILPVPSLKDNEVYAPNYKDGEILSLVRFPHGGKFEIPELIVNNRNKEAQSFMKNAKDAVGINPRVASILSGADFDGDTVLTIPNSDRRIKNAKPLQQLKDFDPKDYSVPDGMQPLRKGWKKGSTKEGTEMGVASNLITDMTLKGASEDELARAVKYSMVVIDTGKHKLDWYKAYTDLNIQQLKRDYQGHISESGKMSYGASTLISRSKGETTAPKHSESYDINPDTGEKIYRPKRDRYGNIVTGTQKSTRMAEAKDARELLSDNPTQMEKIYADYANIMKSLGNKARKESLRVNEPAQNQEAKKKYSKEVESLKNKLIEAKKNAPLERKAQLISDQLMAIKREANPDMSAAEIKKNEGRTLVQARQMVGAGKKRIKFTDAEWEAMNSGAVAKTTLLDLFNNADNDRLMELAMPKSNNVMTPSRLAVANSMLASGNTLADVAEHFGISTKTLSDALRKE